MVSLEVLSKLQHEILVYNSNVSNKFFYHFDYSKVTKVIIILDKLYFSEDGKLNVAKVQNGQEKQLSTGCIARSDMGRIDPIVFKELPSLTCVVDVVMESKFDQCVEGLLSDMKYAIAQCNKLSILHRYINATKSQVPYHKTIKDLERLLGQVTSLYNQEKQTTSSRNDNDIKTRIKGKFDDLQEDELIIECEKKGIVCTGLSRKELLKKLSKARKNDIKKMFIDQWT